MDRAPKHDASDPDMAVERLAGFYWIRFRFDQNWEPAEWTGRKWRVIGSTASRHDQDFGGIGARIDPDA